MHSALFTVLPELWLQIVASLSRSDLSRLSITCRRLLHIIRPILYQSVSLTEDCSDTDPTPTLALLARDTDLAKCVVELRLDKESIFPSTFTQHRYRPSLINIDTLANLLSLKRIVICGIIFRTATEMIEFGRVLCELPLEDFTFIGPTLSESWPGVDVEGIHGLRKIDWAPGNLCTCLFLCHLIQVSIFSIRASPLLYVLNVRVPRQSPRLASQCGTYCPAPERRSTPSRSTSL